MLNLDNADADAETDGNTNELETNQPPAQPVNESSQLLLAAGKVEPPYTAPLAPFDMELVKQVSIKGKLVASDSIWGDGSNRNNPDVDATTVFMNSERGNDAAKPPECHQVNH